MAVQINDFLRKTHEKRTFLAFHIKRYCVDQGTLLKPWRASQRAKAVGKD